MSRWRPPAPPDQHNPPIADSLLQARDDALGLADLERGWRDVRRTSWLIHAWGPRLAVQDRQRAESRLTRMRSGGNAKISFSRLSCACVFRPDRSASSSARRSRSSSSRSCWASTCSICTFITSGRVARSGATVDHLSARQVFVAVNFRVPSQSPTRRLLNGM